MKLRISGNSIRFRIRRSELARLLETGRIEETIHFGSSSTSALTYALAAESGLPAVELRHAPAEIAICIPRDQASIWADSEQVGIYATLHLEPYGPLELMVEKDFACLDRDEADSADAFPNPQAGVVC